MFATCKRHLVKACACLDAALPATHCNTILFALSWPCSALVICKNEICTLSDRNPSTKPLKMDRYPFKKALSKVQ